MSNITAKEMCTYRTKRMILNGSQNPNTVSKWLRCLSRLQLICKVVNRNFPLSRSSQGLLINQERVW